MATSLYHQDCVDRVEKVGSCYNSHFVWHLCVKGKAIPYAELCELLVLSKTSFLQVQGLKY